MLFIEHVRASGERLARAQDRLDGLWRHIGNGCHGSRDTTTVLRAAGFRLSDVRDAISWRMPWRLIRPLAHGVAVKT